MQVTTSPVRERSLSELREILSVEDTVYTVRKRGGLRVYAIADGALRDITHHVARVCGYEVAYRRDGDVLVASDGAQVVANLVTELWPDEVMTAWAPGFWLHHRSL